MKEGIIVALIGLAGGILGSLFAPWANWKIEQKKQKSANRREELLSWRNKVASIISDLKRSQWRLDNWSPDYAEHHFGVLGEYLDDWSDFLILKNYLKPETLAKINESRDAIWDDNVADALNSILEDIRSLEIKWGLI